MVLSPNTISTYISKRIVGSIPEYEPKRDEIRYGLEWIISGLFQFLLICLLGFPFHIGQEAMVCLVCGSVLRALSGGTHLSGYFRCLLLGSFLILVFAFASILLSSYLPDGFRLILWTLPVVLTGYYIYTPKLYRKRDCIPKHEKQAFKRKACLTALIIALLLTFLPVDQSVSMAGWFGMVFQMFTLTPGGEQMIKFLNQKLNKNEKLIMGGR